LLSKRIMPLGVNRTGGRIVDTWLVGIKGGLIAGTWGCGVEQERTATQAGTADGRITWKSCR